MRPQSRRQRIIAQLQPRHPNPPSNPSKPNLLCIALNRTLPVLGDGRFERHFRVGAPLGGQPVETDRVDDRMWAPTSEPFSRTTTDRLAPSCFSRIAAARPAGPAPTMTTSNSIASRTGSSLEDSMTFPFRPLVENQAAAHGRSPRRRSSIAPGESLGRKFAAYSILPLEAALPLQARERRRRDAFFGHEEID